MPVPQGQTPNPFPRNPACRCSTSQGKPRLQSAQPNSRRSVTSEGRYGRSRCDRQFDCSRSEQYCRLGLSLEHRRACSPLGRARATARFEALPGSLRCRQSRNRLRVSHATAVSRRLTWTTTGFISPDHVTAPVPAVPGQFVREPALPRSGASSVIDLLEAVSPAVVTPFHEDRTVGNAWALLAPSLETRMSSRKRCG